MLGRVSSIYTHMGPFFSLQSEAVFSGTSSFNDNQPANMHISHTCVFSDGNKLVTRRMVPHKTRVLNRQLLLLETRNGVTLKVVHQSLDEFIEIISDNFITNLFTNLLMTPCSYK